MHDATVNKLSLECAIYRIETIKNRFERGLDFASKNWVNPTKL